MQKNNDIVVLNSIYRNAQTGYQAISDILPKTDNAGFRSDLKTQEGQYKAIVNEASSRLAGLGTEPESVSSIKKASMKVMAEMNTMMNNDTTHLAEMMIQGSNMGITNMTKVLNGYPDPNPDVKNLADRLITIEHQNIERLKTYLG